MMDLKALIKRLNQILHEAIESGVNPDTIMVSGVHEEGDDVTFYPVAEESDVDLVEFPTDLNEEGTIRYLYIDSMGILDSLSDNSEPKL